MQAPSLNQPSPQTEFPGGINSPSNPSPVAPVATETDSVQLAVLERSVLPKDKVSLSGETQDKSKTPDKSSKEAKGSVVKDDEVASADKEKALSEQQEKELIALQARDAEVKAHERAHKAVGGQYAGSISYDYQQGPSGKRYAVGGEVSIDVSPVSGDPEKTIEKMNVIKPLRWRRPTRHLRIAVLRRKPHRSLPPHVQSLMPQKKMKIRLLKTMMLRLLTCVLISAILVHITLLANLKVKSKTLPASLSTI